MKYCKHCGQQINSRAVVCIHCGLQVETLAVRGGRGYYGVESYGSNSQRYKPKNKWIALLLCIFLGAFGGHKFYEGKTGMGITYLFTCGLLGFFIIDIFIILCKPTYYID